MARRRRDLTRDEIFQAALELAEREGLAAVSMRKVAQAVGVEAMSLYHHVSDKDALVDGIVDTVLARWRIPEPTGDWSADARAIARAFRRLAADFPRTAPLVLTRQSFSPALLRASNTMLGILLDAGFDRAQAVHALRVLLATVVGALLREFGASPTLGGTDPTDQERRVGLLVESGLPRLAEVSTELATLDPDAEFEFALTVVLDSLERLRRGETLLDHGP